MTCRGQGQGDLKSSCPTLIQRGLPAALQIASHTTAPQTLAILFWPTHFEFLVGLGDEKLAKAVI